VRDRRAGWVWGGRVAAVVMVAGLAVYLFIVGLDRAVEIAAVLGLLVAIAALVAPYLWPTSERSSLAPEPTQSITNTVVGGHLTQVRDVHDVQVQNSDAVSPPQDAPPGDDSAPDKPGGQYVNGVWVGGNLTQVDGADGDVSIG
jgi:hypothetical protein